MRSVPVLLVHGVAGKAQEDHGDEETAAKRTIRRARRTSSRNPAMGSDQWWVVRIPMAASKLWSNSGRHSAAALMHGAASADRCFAISSEGSTARRTRSAASYEPV